MAIDSDRRKLLLAAVLLAMVALAGCSRAIPHLCYSCEDGLEEATREQSGLDVGDSSLTIHVQSDGDAQWHVRAEVSGVNESTLAGNQSEVDRIARRAVYGSSEFGRHSPINRSRISNLDAVLRDDTLHLRFEVEDVAEARAGGILVVDLFHGEGSSRGWRLGADRLTMQGPNDSVVLQRPSGARKVGDNRLVWNGSPPLPETGYVVFGPDNGPVTRLLATFTVGFQVLGWVFPRLPVALPFVGALFGLAVALPGAHSARVSSWPHSDLRSSITVRNGIAVVAIVVAMVYAMGGGPSSESTAGQVGLLWAPALLYGAHAVAVRRGTAVREQLTLLLAGYPLVLMGGLAARPPDAGLLQFVLWALSFLLVLTAATTIVGLVAWHLCFFGVGRAEQGSSGEA